MAIGRIRQKGDNMKIIYFLIITCSFIILSNPSYAMKATTDAGSVACFSKNDLSDMTQFVASKDQESFKAYIDAKRCIIMNGGLDVTIVDSPGMLGGYSGFVFRGTKMWTTRKGLTNYREP